MLYSFSQQAKEGGVNMTNEQLLSEIGTLIDQKFDKNFDRKFSENFDKKFDEKLDEKLDKKFDEKLKPIYDRLDGIDNRLDGIDDRLDGIDDRLDNMDARLINVELTQENKILPALNELSVLYSSTFKKYHEKAEKIDRMEADIEILKKITAEHSRTLQKIS